MIVFFTRRGNFFRISVFFISEVHKKSCRRLLDPILVSIFSEFDEEYNYDLFKMLSRVLMG